MISVKAMEFAKNAHKNQYRKFINGIPYITHPARVASRVLCLPNYKDYQVNAAWLHDVMEDCGVTRGDLMLAGFDSDTISTVEGLTNKSTGMKLPRRKRKLIDIEYIAKQPEETRIIKLIDRIDNLRDMLNAPFDFLRLYIDESKKLYKNGNLNGLDIHLDAEFTQVLEYLEGQLSTHAF